VSKNASTGASRSRRQQENSANISNDNVVQLDDLARFRAIAARIRDVAESGCLRRLVFALRDAPLMCMEPHIVRLGRSLEMSQNDADAIADLHTRSRQVAYRGLYGDAYLDHGLFSVSRATWRARFEDFDPTADLILAAMDGGDPVGLAYASFRLNPQVGLLIDNLHVAPERKGGGLGTALLAEVARWLIEEHASAPLHLEVYAPNAAALGFYERKGGVEVARYAEVVPGGRQVDTVRYRWERPSTLLS
jgi:GNAT superfamily N-acetyltransferase